MSQLADELGVRLEQVVPPLGGPDWSDVLERAELLRRAVPRRRGWRRLPVASRALAFAIVVLLAGSSIALAFGLRALVDGSAPPHVKREFRQITRAPFPLDGAPPMAQGALPGAIVPGSEHRVLLIRTGPKHVVALYAARSSKGQTCFVSVGTRFPMTGCSDPSGARGPFATLEVQQVGKARARPASWSMLGRVKRGSRVRVVYADATQHDLTPVNGWFLYEIPLVHTRTGAQPVRLDVLTRTGARLGSVDDPFVIRVARRHFPAPVSSSVRLLARETLPNAGGTVTVSTGRDPAGNECFRHLRDGKSQVHPVWDCRADVGRDGVVAALRPGAPLRSVPVEWDQFGANDARRPVGYGYSYATGWVGPGITRLSLRFQDGGATEIALRGHYFLYVVPPAHWPAGRRPSILEARNASGAVVYRRFLYPRQHCIYPGRDPLCRGRALGTG
jgi:hypothetical protein